MRTTVGYIDHYRFMCKTQIYLNNYIMEDLEQRIKDELIEFVFKFSKDFVANSECTYKQKDIQTWLNKNL